MRGKARQGCGPIRQARKGWSSEGIHMALGAFPGPSHVLGGTRHSPCPPGALGQGERDKPLCGTLIHPIEAGPGSSGVPTVLNPAWRWDGKE